MICAPEGTTNKDIQRIEKRIMKNLYKIAQLRESVEYDREVLEWHREHQRLRSHLPAERG